MRGQIIGEAWTAVAETAGLSEEELRQARDNGQTMADVVEKHGGDLTALSAELETLFADLPEADELDLKQATADWLGVMGD